MLKIILNSPLTGSVYPRFQMLIDGSGIVHIGIVPRPRNHMQWHMFLRMPSQIVGFDLAQAIALAHDGLHRHVQLGRGSAITRPPRLALEGETRAQVVAIVEKALATRPQLPDVGL